MELTGLFAENWDDGVVGPIDRAEAARRDAAGEPYAVVFAADGRCRAVLRVGGGHVGLWRCDADGHPESVHDWRRHPGGDLFLRQVDTWSGPMLKDHDGTLRRASHERTTWWRSGIRTHRSDAPLPGGGSRNTGDDMPEESPRLPIPAFGAWEPLFGADVTLSETTGTGGLPASPTGRPWTVPTPLRFGGYEGKPEPAGSVNLPSGRIVAADPHTIGTTGDHAALTVTVPPGTYPVTVFVAQIGDDPTHHRVSAARLEITGEPVARWEMALREGQDLLDLGDREFFGFGVDAGTASFMDAANATRLAEADVSQEIIDHFEGTRSDAAHCAAADGDVVAWYSGWGDGAYPVWIGRSADGTVACVVSDMLLGL